MKFYISAIFLILSFEKICLCQNSPNEYSVTYLTTQDGLRQATSRYILQDDKGYMWISTQEGINRYNGRDFFHFNHPRFYEDCKPFKQIVGLIKDGKGDLWIGTMQGLYKYQQAKNTFKNFDVFPSSKNAIKITKPFASVEDEVWVSDCTGNFVAINVKTNTVRKIFSPPDSAQILQSWVVNPEVDKKENIWFAVQNSMYKINTTEQTIDHFGLYPNKSETDIDVRSISIDNNKQILAISTNNGLVLFNTDTRQNIPINDPQHLITQNSTSYVKAVKDHFVLASNGFPLIRVSTTGDSISQLINPKAVNHEIPNFYNPICIYADKSGRLWYTLDGEFIAIFDFTPSFIKKIIKGKNGLEQGTVSGFCNIKDSVWICDGQINVLDRKTGLIIKKYFNTDLQGNAIGLHHPFYDPLLNRVWFTATGKLYYRDNLKRKFIKPGFEFPGVDASIDLVRNFVRLNNDELLVASREGIYRIEKNGATAILLNYFGKAQITHLASLTGNRLALSAINQPLKIFGVEESSFKLLETIQLETTINMAVEDSTKGYIWAATEHGVFRIDNRSYKVLQHYSTADGMADDFVYAVLPDKYGWIWCSSNRGIIAINTADNSILNFDMNHNLQDLEYNNLAFAEDEDGYIYFGGVKGMNYFKPPFIDNDSLSPRLIVEEINLNNKPFSNKINTDELNEIVYSYGTTALSIKMIALHLKKAKNLKILYRLKNESREWIEINNGDFIQMFDLSPGKYVLEVCYKDAGKVFDRQGRTLTILVMPPWYRTWWFFTLVFALLITGVYILFRYRLNQKLKLFAVRQRLHRDLHDDVGATLSSVKAYSEILKENPNNPVIAELIKNNSTEMIERLEVIAWATNPQHDNFKSLHDAMLKFARPLCHSKDIEFDFQKDGIDDQLMIPGEVRQNILLVFKEAINNMIKYAEAKSCNARMYIKSQQFHLEIKDDGIGHDGVIRGQGAGLTNMKKRAGELNGKLDIESGSGKGTVVRLSLPYPFKIPNIGDKKRNTNSYL